MEHVQKSVVFDASMQNRKKQSIDEIMQETSVLSILRQAGLSRGFVEDHWIDFLDYVGELNACKACPGLAQCPKNFKGYMRLLTIDQGEVVRYFEACEQQQEDEKKRQAMNRIQANVAKNLLETSFKDIQYDNGGNLLQVATALMNQITMPSAKGIYLHGEMGTGKTYVMAAFCNALAINQKDCAFISMPQLLADLKSRFNNPGEADLLAELKVVPYLVLDDLGAETLSVWGRDDVLYTLLNERMNRRLPTYFTSVYDLAMLEQHYTMNKSRDEMIKAKRLVERVKAVSVPMELVGKNFR